MKKVKGLVVCSLLVGGALLFVPLMLVTASEAADASVTMKYASSTPSVGFTADQERYIGQEIEKRTEGRVKVQVYFGGSLLKIPEGLDGVSKGVADMVLIPPLWFPGQIPLITYSQVTSLGPTVEALEDPRVVGKALWKLWDDVPAIRKETEKWNQTVWAFRPMPPYQLWSKVPIQRLEDLNRLKVRELGVKGKVMFGTYGAIPTSVTPSEMYGALQKGLLDAAVASFDWGELYRLREVAKYLVMPYFNGGAPSYNINMDFLKKLSPQDREIIMKLGREFTVTYADGLSKYMDDLMKKYQEAGVIITRFPKDERQRWRKEGEPKLIDGWLMELKEASPDDGKKVIETYLTAMGGADVIPWLAK
jgi:TRAP-type transport system periplasmic protein